MANLQVKDVPDELHERLRDCAARRGTTIREIVLEAVRHELEHERFLARLETRRAVDLGVPIVELLSEEREERERRL
jgi:plasmid stability protein